MAVIASASGHDSCLLGVKSAAQIDRKVQETLIVLSGSQRKSELHLDPVPVRSSIGCETPWEAMRTDESSNGLVTHLLR